VEETKEMIKEAKEINETKEMINDKVIRK